MFGVSKGYVSRQNLVTDLARLTTVSTCRTGVSITILQYEPQHVAQLLELSGGEIALGLIFLEAGLAQPSAPAMILVLEVEIVHRLGSLASLADPDAECRVLLLDSFWRGWMSGPSLWTISTWRRAVGRWRSLATLESPRFPDALR